MANWTRTAILAGTVMSACTFSDPELRTAAAFTLRCPERDIRLRRMARGWTEHGAKGCGRRVVMEQRCIYYSDIRPAECHWRPVTE